VSVALAGGTGFTGRRVAALLAASGRRLRCLVRSTSDRSALPQGAEWLVGDLGDPEAVAAWASGCEELVSCASMGFGHVPRLVAEAERANVRRAVFVSTTGVFTRLPSRSKLVRVEAEECVRGSALEWTILRPTMIYGAPGDRNMERLLRFLARWPVAVVPGDGRALVQPVHVDDLASAIVSALDSDLAVGRVYEVSGADALPLDDAIDAAARALGRRRRKLHLPLGPVASTLRFAERMRLPLPIRSEQVLRLSEDKAFAHTSASDDLGFAPRTFAQGIADEARLLGLARDA
jgi:nucleoside-diphosphate-sugar epimerase